MSQDGDEFPWGSTLWEGVCSLTGFSCSKGLGVSVTSATSAGVSVCSLGVGSDLFSSKTAAEDCSTAVLSSLGRYRCLCFRLFFGSEVCSTAFFTSSASLARSDILSTSPVARFSSTAPAFVIFRTTLSLALSVGSDIGYPSFRNSFLKAENLRPHLRGR